ncbi:DUF3618 domain-containing protein [Nocardia carnea]|uniref:DUF3618 domain-containing protein n=1 Tax=Nocardia carnea TaxID=37328 RepID=UPI0024555A9B|nr:DUF3618 domain-containing protein [Nocardia carnea]
MTESDRHAPENDREALRQDRDQVRRELRETVDELTAKLDVRARAQGTVHQAADGVRHQVALAERSVRDSSEQVKDRAHHLLVRTEARTPEPLAERGRSAAEFLRSRPVPAASAAAAAALVTWLILRRRMS